MSTQGIKFDNSVVKLLGVLATCAVVTVLTSFAEENIGSNRVKRSLTDDASDAVMALSRRLVREFAEEAQPRMTPELVGPDFPGIPDNVRGAIDFLVRAKDKQGLADVAAVLLRYARKDMEESPPGHDCSRSNQIVRAILETFKPELLRGEIISSTVARWICRNREQMGESPLLDREVTMYEQLQKRKQEEVEQFVLKSVQTLPEMLLEMSESIVSGILSRSGGRQEWELSNKRDIKGAAPGRTIFYVNKKVEDAEHLASLVDGQVGKPAVLCLPLGGLASESVCVSNVWLFLSRSDQDRQRFRIDGCNGVRSKYMTADINDLVHKVELFGNQSRE